MNFGNNCYFFVPLSWLILKKYNMKRAVTIFLSLLVGFAFVDAQAQLTKAEKKEWKTKAKEFKKNPELLKNLVEESESLRGQVSSLNSQLTNLQSSVNDKDAKISELQDDVNRMRRDLASAQNAARELRAQMEANPKKNTNWDQGVVFKVQIGAFKKKDLSKYFEENDTFGGEARESGEQAITLGNYRDYWEADTFKKYLREMGVKDAWIVPYSDGQRVELKDVLEGVTADQAESGK